MPRVLHFQAGQAYVPAHLSPAGDLGLQHLVVVGRLERVYEAYA